MTTFELVCFVFGVLALLLGSIIVAIEEIIKERKMDEKQIQDLIDITKLLTGLHYSAFCSYMKLTSDDIEMSSMLAKDFLSSLLNSQLANGGTT